MIFVFRMAWREMRASWARLLFFFLCVAIGVAAIVSLRSLVQDVRRTLATESRSMIAADVVVQSPRLMSDDVRARIEEAVGAAPMLARTEVVQTTTMVRPVQSESVRLVELRGVSDAYPFYGTMTLASGRPYSHALLEEHGAIVQPELLAQLGIGVGASILIGGQPFIVRDVLVKDRVQRSGFALGPRVYVDRGDLERTGLFGFGARVTDQMLLKLDERQMDAVTDRLRRAFQRDVLTVQSAHSLNDRVGQSLAVGENYLSLVGFAIVVLGGIGIWSVTRVFVQQKIRSVAILKCVGCGSGRILAIYLAQVSLMSATGGLLGIALAAAALGAVPQRVLDVLNAGAARVTVSAAAQGFTVGLLISILFAVVPLLEIRRVKPLLLLRADTTDTARRRDWRSVGAGGLIAAAVALVAIWQAGSLRAGLYVSVGLGAAVLVLDIASRGLTRLVAPLTRVRRFAVRHAVVSLGRPGNQTRVILMAVGIGAFFVLSIRAVETSILAEFSTSSGREAPDLVLIDIQPDQEAGIAALVTAHTHLAPAMLPLLRARIVAVHGRRVSLPTADDVRRDGSFTREYGITFRDELADNERTVAGAFWSSPLPPTGTPDGLDTEVSIEETQHTELGLDLGDLLSFDVAGRVVRARVTHIRKVMWDDTLKGGFMFVFRPGPIERAPHTFVGFVAGLPEPADRAALERDLMGPFPNVSAIDVREILSSIQTVLQNVSLAVTMIGAVTLVGGVLILAGAVAMTKFQRLYETAVYRTLGAGSRAIVTMVAVEYGLLGLLAGGLGAGGAAALSWAVSTRLLQITWHPTPALLFGGLGLTALLVTTVGVVSSLDVVLRKPLATLRGE